MAKLFVGITFVKSGAGTVQYVGADRLAAKAAVAAVVNSGAASRGLLLSDRFLGFRVGAKNPAGT